MSGVYSGDPCERSDPKVYEPQIQLFGVFPMLSLDEKIFAGIMADSPAGLHASRPGKWSVVMTVLVAIVVLTREVIRINVLPRADSVRIRVRERGSEDRSTDSPSWDRASMHATDGRDVAHGRSMTSQTEPTAISAATPSAATPQAEELLPTRALGQKSSAVTSTVECRDNRTIARTGGWSRAGQRLGNTICMLGRALREAEDAGGGVLELLSPGSRFYNTTGLFSSYQRITMLRAPCVRRACCYSPLQTVQSVGWMCVLSITLDEKKKDVHMPPHRSQIKAEMNASHVFFI
jgi:hypothetical protein